MTLPFMKKKAAFDNELQRSLEANGVFTLAHRFSPHFRCILTGSSMDASAVVDSAKRRSFTPDQAVNVANRALGDFSMVTPPPTPTPTPRPAKKPRTRRSSSTLPTADDPMDEPFCMKLYSMGEEGNINRTHTVIRRDVLEIRRTQSGEIFFQCAFCKHCSRGDRAKQSTLAPQSIESLYRAVIRFMMYHVPACEHIPQEIKDLIPKATMDVKARVTKKYWFDSAFDKGLRDGEDEDGRSIIYCMPT